ncbi:sporulation protein YabP [Bacillota bacterium LX-D]|nr:sporulation protein YabP [Bacillota bacterium LX-D]
MADKEHLIKLDERKQLLITGVIHVDNYDEEEITLQTTLGLLIIKGEELNISVLNLENGTLNVSGRVNQLTYTDGQGKKAKSLIQRILK